MTYQAVGVSAAERPKCWGKDFNSEDRECKGCSWQASCRDQVIRSAVNRQPAVQPAPSPVMNYYQPFQPQQYAAPQPQPMPFQIPKPAPAPIQVQPAPQYQVTQYKPPMPAPVQLPHPIASQPAPTAVTDWYGRFQDPLHYSLMSAPPPFRPQMQGESFVERVGKNMLLAGLEAIAMQGVLAIRQMVLPPMVRRSNLVDVTPEKK